jgi:hypothetical protein
MSGEPVEVVVYELIDRLAPRGRADLVREFTFAFPVQVIARLMIAAAGLCAVPAVVDRAAERGVRLGHRDGGISDVARGTPRRVNRPRRCRGKMGG